MAEEMLSVRSNVRFAINITSDKMKEGMLGERMNTSLSQADAILLKYYLFTKIRKNIHLACGPANLETFKRVSGTLAVVSKSRR